MLNSSKIYDPKYARFLENKRIAVIGPAPHILGSKQGKEIDEFDLVCRVGRSFNIPPELKDWPKWPCQYCEYKELCQRVEKSKLKDWEKVSNT